MSTLEHYKKKFLGFLTPNQQNEIQVTNKGFVYKGNLMVAIRDLDKLVKEEKVEVAEPSSKEIVTEIVNKVHIQAEAKSNTESYDKQSKRKPK